VARERDAQCRQCRREGEKLFLKGERCLTDKCGIERRAYPPGQNGRGRIRQSEYLLQLREKQRARRFYGVLETQFRRYYDKASRQQGITGENLLRLLELRLDNVVTRLGFAASRRQGRQLVRHGHFMVNGRKVDIPSFSVKPGDVIAIRQSSRANAAIAHALEEVKGRGVPEWLVFDAAGMSAKVGSIPTREQINLPVQEQLIVELYSK
jgi:small subunit ribosomal protein S4